LYEWRGEAAFWFPLIALLSGMRLEEIAGLRIHDLRQDEETRRWFFDVHPHGGRSVKTASSIRTVPVHPELERIGLLLYRQSVAAEQSAKAASARSAHSASLWPALRTQVKGRPVSAQWPKWCSAASCGRRLGSRIAARRFTPSAIPASAWHAMRGYRRRCTTPL